MFGEGEKEQFGAEIMRLGRKNVNAMCAVERQILYHSLCYQYCGDFEGGFELTVDEILKW